MNDKITRYLFVDSRDMTMSVYKCYKELVANDYINLYIKDIIMSASKVFKKNNVPKDFRKIIIKLNRIITPSNSKKINSNEFVSGKRLKLSVSKKGNVRTFEGINEHDENVLNWYYGPQNTFLVNDKSYSYESVIEYFKQMKENGCLEDYLKSLYEILGFTYFEYEQDEFLENSKKFILEIK